MVYIDELQDLYMYKKPFFLPRNGKDKRKGNMAFLLTPGFTSSMNLMKHTMLNPKFYNNYYLEKDLSLYINNEGTLERLLDNEEYVHETVEGKDTSYVNEGYFKHVKQKLTYNGYQADIVEVMNYINIPAIETLNKDLHAPIDYPISVTVYRNSNYATDTNNKSICVMNMTSMSDTNDYSMYCQEEIYSMLIHSINPKVNDVLCDAIVMVLSGTYNKNKDNFATDTELQGYNFICMAISQIISEPNGYSKLTKIIKKNDVPKAYKVGVKTTIKSLTEAKMTPLKKLKRNITFTSRRGSAHLLNNTVRKIEATTDPTASNPEFKTNNDIEPTIDTEKKTDIPVVDANEKKIPTPTIGSSGTQVSESLLESYNISSEGLTEQCIYLNENVVTFFNEEAANPLLRKILYKERLRTNKDVLNIYDKVKFVTPYVTNTYLNLERYKSFNTFVDLFYYNEIFFKNVEFVQANVNKIVDLYYDFLYNILNNTKFDTAGYTGKKIVIIPVLDWNDNPDTKMWIYNKDFNPVSFIYRLLRIAPDKVKNIFTNKEVIFIGSDRYFTVNFANYNDSQAPKFLELIKKILANEPMEDDIDAKTTDSRDVIFDTIVDKLEDGQDIKVHYLTGDTEAKKQREKEIEAISTNKKKEEELAKDSKKEELVEKIKQVADDSQNVDDALAKLDQDDEFKQILVKLAQDEQNGPTMTNARKNRISTLDEELMKKSINGMTVKQMLARKEKYTETALEPIELPIDSINPEWKQLTYAAMATQYDPNDDIVAMLRDLSTYSYPVSVKDIQVTDNSTNEDYILTYRVEMESYNGKRSVLVFDIPKVMNGQYMKLRGNKKVISTQSFLAPVVKSEKDTVQIISNYNKIFIRRYNTSTGRSNIITNAIIKTLLSTEFKGDIKVVTGNNENVCNRYDLPIDYIDMASVITRVEAKNIIFYFNPKEIRDKYKDKIDYGKGIPVAVKKDPKTKQEEIMYYNSKDNQFALFSQYFDAYMFEAFGSATPGSDIELYLNGAKKVKSVRGTYSKASILNTEIPLVILGAYAEGLETTMNKAGVKYELTEKKDRDFNIGYRDYIKFSDGYILFDNTYSSSLLMNGLKECDTESISLADINKRSTYYELLDQFGGKLKSDGLDNFYDCMIDSITRSILEYYNLPDDYVSLLMYANELLADNGFTRHSNMDGRRLRRNELIAAYTFGCLASSYGSYASSIKHGRDTIMSMKRTAVIDAILLDTTCGDLSIINALNEKESYDAVTPRGKNGMNSDRSYSLDKRAYDESMINVLGMSTGFASTVGINRQATIDCSVKTARGFVVPSSQDKMSSVTTMCMSEAVSPYVNTGDDPFRCAMTYIQTTRHGMRVKHSDPCLITNGADKALPYLISDIFAHKAKGKGQVVEKVDDNYMIIKYEDGTTNEYVDLSEKIEKNSSSGFYISIKLDTDLKLGDKVKKGTIVAYDRQSFNPTVGIDNDIAYEIGTLASCVLIDTDEGYEDSAAISDDLADAMTSDIIERKEVNLDKNTNIYNLIKPGTPVDEGDILMTIQTPFDEEDANALLKNLVDDEETISNLGRIPIKSKVTGRVQAIDISRTVEIEELSESLQKICKAYEAPIKQQAAAMKKYNIDSQYMLKPHYKLDPIGRLKGTGDGVNIAFSLLYEDKMSIGDKLIYWSANKGVVKYIFPDGKVPYVLGHPDQKIHSLVAIASTNGRMVTSIQNVGVIQYLLIEAVRAIKDKIGMKYTRGLY